MVCLLFCFLSNTAGRLFLSQRIPSNERPSNEAMRRDANCKNKKSVTTNYDDDDDDDDDVQTPLSRGAARVRGAAHPFRPGMSRGRRGRGVLPFTRRILLKIKSLEPVCFSSISPTFEEKNVQVPGTDTCFFYFSIPTVKSSHHILEQTQSTCVKRTELPTSRTCAPRRDTRRGGGVAS